MISRSMCKWALWLLSVDHHKNKRQINLMAASLPNQKSGLIVFRNLLERSHVIIRRIPIQALQTSRQLISAFRLLVTRRCSQVTTDCVQQRKQTYRGLQACVVHIAAVFHPRHRRLQRHCFTIRVLVSFCKTHSLLEKHYAFQKMPSPKSQRLIWFMYTSGGKCHASGALDTPT